jgi:hypothetical protein
MTTYNNADDNLFPPSSNSIWHVRMPADLRAAVAKVAAAEDRSSASALRRLCREGLDRRSTGARGHDR